MTYQLKRQVKPGLFVVVKIPEHACLQPCSQESFKFFNISIAKISHEGSIPCSHYNYRYGYQAKFSNHVRKHLLGILKTKRKPGLRNHELSVSKNSLLFHISVRKNSLKIRGFFRVSPNINPKFRPVILVALFRSVDLKCLLVVIRSPGLIDCAVEF